MGAVAVGVLAAEEGAGEAEQFDRTLAMLRERALGSRNAFELVRSLVVEVGPRFAGTPGDRAAVAWGVRTMERLGFEQVRAEPVTVPRWVRGEAAGAIVTPHPQPLVLAALGGSVGTPEAGLRAPVVELRTLEELEAAPGEAIKGRIVFLNQRMERARDGAGYGRTVPIRTRGAEEAAAKGAVAVLIRSVGTGNHRFPHTGTVRYDPEVPRIPAAALAVPDADLLEMQLAGGAEAVVELRLGSHYLPDVESANVVGELPGRELPGEVVLLGAHLDAWDLGPGAVDDGAGCAIVLEAARLIAEVAGRPRRTVRVVLFANEEFGLSGARAYAERYAESLATHQLAVESDFGGGRVWRFRSRVAPPAVPAVASLAARLEPLGIEWQGNRGRGGADLRPLAAAGVPVADLTQDGTYYFDVHHTADDTLDKLDPGDLAQNVAAYAVLAYWAAETRIPLGPAPTGDAE